MLRPTRTPTNNGPPLAAYTLQKQLANTYDKLGLSRQSFKVGICPASKQDFESGNRFPCRDPMCPYCSWRSGLRTARRLDTRLANALNPYLITLTTPIGTGYMPRDLLQALRAIRRRVFWKSNIPGGVRFVEVKRIGDFLCPHLHIIIDYAGGYLGVGDVSIFDFQHLLAVAWARFFPECDTMGRGYASGKHVDVKPVDASTGESRKRLLRYPHKSPDCHNNPSLVTEYFSIFAGVHRVACFGNWHGKHSGDGSRGYYSINSNTPSPGTFRLPPDPIGGQQVLRL